MAISEPQVEDADLSRGNSLHQCVCGRCPRIEVRVPGRLNGHLNRSGGLCSRAVGRLLGSYFWVNSCRETGSQWTNRVIGPGLFCTSCNERNWHRNGRALQCSEKSGGGVLLEPDDVTRAEFRCPSLLMRLVCPLFSDATIVWSSSLKNRNGQLNLERKNPRFHTQMVYNQSRWMLSSIRNNQ